MKKKKARPLTTAAAAVGRASPRHLLAAVLSVYAGRETSGAGPPAASDLYTVSDELRAKTTRAVAVAWEEATGRSRYEFPYTDDAVAAVYVRCRKESAAWRAKAADPENIRGVADKMAWVKPLPVFRSVLAVFRRNVDQEIFNGITAKSDEWTARDARRYDVHRRAAALWVDAAEGDHYVGDFPYTAAGVAFLYLKIRKRSDRQIKAWEEELGTL